MLSFRLASTFLAARCLAPSVAHAAKRPVRALVALALACMGGCTPSSIVYRGSASFQRSAEASELTSHTLELTICHGDPSADPPVPEFTVVAIGDQCVMPGRGYGETFEPDPGAACTVSFAEGQHTLRVTHTSTQYGVTGAPITGNTYRDQRHVELALAGADEATGKYALYHFSGNAISASNERSARCDALRSAHERALASLP